MYCTVYILCAVFNKFDVFKSTVMVLPGHSSILDSTLEPVVSLFKVLEILHVHTVRMYVLNIYVQ